MATPSQIRANRENAKSSTGPRSEAGIQATKYNALRHGLAAKDLLVIVEEDPAELDVLRATLREQHSPANEIEEMLVDEIAQCWWRLQRARKHEAWVVSGTFKHFRPYPPDAMNGISRYMSSAERGWHRAITQLRVTQNDRRKNQQSAEAQPQAAEPEKVMAVGSVLQNDFEAPSAPEPPSEPTTDHWPLTTEIGSVLQNDPEPPGAAASELTTDNRQLTTNLTTNH
jgi:hypothetical protein